MTHFIQETIHVDIDGKDTDAVLQIPKETAISYSRPIDPTQFPDKWNEEEKSYARALQFHKCNMSTCLKLVHGRFVCKCKAPFAISSEAWVDKHGSWGPKRLCPQLNNWNPYILRTARCNHDVKLIMNGGETCVLVLYTTNYAFKKQNRLSNVTALIADKLTLHHDVNKDADIMTYNKKLLERCANALFTEREFSGPEIESYLMGWGNLFESHFYVSIYLDRCFQALRRAYPSLSDR